MNPPTDEWINEYLDQYPMSEREAFNVIARSLIGIRHDLQRIAELLGGR